MTLLLVLVLILPLRYSSPVEDNEHNDEIYAPVDTAIISFSYTFCDSLSLLSPDADFDAIEAKLYLLSAMPELGKENKAGFYREISLTDNYEYWRMFLYPGSKTSYSACFIQSSTVVFYLVKGKVNYERWRFGHSSSHIHQQNINVSCEENDNVTFTFEVEEEDNYYFIFVSELTSSVTGVTFDFERVLYDVSNSSSLVISECSIVLNDSSTSCQVGVPLSSKTIALLELDSLVPDPMEWDASIRVRVECSTRVWLYVVIALSACVLVGLLGLAAFILYLYCCGQGNEGGSRQAPQDEPQDEDSHLITGHDKNPVYDAPPPYKPKPSEEGEGLH